MNGCEALKRYREEKKYSVRKFAVLAEISPRAVSYYECGGKDISCIPVSKAILYFGLLDIPIEAYFSQYFSYKDEIDLNLQKWKKENTTELRYSVLKKRIYSRLAKYKERNTIAPEILERITKQYETVFEKLATNTDTKGNISENDFKEFVLPLYYEIKAEMHPLPENKLCGQILDGIYKTEFSVSDTAVICGVSYSHLWGCLTEIYDFKQLQIVTALKLCYLLKLDFIKTFGSVFENKQKN